MIDTFACGNATCLISTFDNNGLSEANQSKIRWVSHLFVDAENRNKGSATALMQQICKDADSTNLHLILEPKSYDDGDLDNTSLETFYKKFGFKKIQDEPALMLRAPIPLGLLESLLKPKKINNVIQDVYGRTLN